MQYSLIEVKLYFETTFFAKKTLYLLHYYMGFLSFCTIIFSDNVQHFIQSDNENIFREMEITIKEEITTTSTSALNIIKAINDLWSNMGGTIVTIVSAPILFITFLLVLALFLILSIPIAISNRQLKKYLIELRTLSIETEEDYDLFKKAYIRIRAVNQQYISLDDFPKFMRFFGRSYNTALKLVKQIRKELAVKLCLLPKGLTDEQIEKALELNAGIIDILEEEDDDGYDYAKALALGEIEFIKR
ncbi:MAG: hypothetical protein ACRBFS_07875 [Aureispira sp.]